MKTPKMKFFRLILVAFVLFTCVTQAQNVGLRYNSNDVQEGYVLFTPEKNENVYLIDQCGRVVNEWTFTEKPGLSCYLLEDGTLLRAGKDSLEIRDWDNTLLWSYHVNGNGMNQHHDIEPLPNGNILMVIADNYPVATMTDEGRDPSNTDNVFKLDKIVEIEPVGTNDANIVWEWKVIDHLVQDFDNTKQNYDVVEDHPELIDVNYDNGYTGDFIHLNAIDYNATLDQIVMSPRHFNEIWIIDHSTTTAEAAGHTGGNSGMGGDLLWRWGNPEAYRQGDSTDRKLFLQHDPKWIPQGYPNEGMISVFNNGHQWGSNLSSIVVVAPEINAGNYVMTAGVFEPSDFTWEWTGQILGEDLAEGKKCGVQAQPNGNFLFCETSKGQGTEVKPDGTIVWTYKNPHGTTVYNQQDVISNNDNGVFRFEKYPSSYAGFAGKDLTPGNLIESNNSVSNDCIGGVNIKETEFSDLTIQNPVSSQGIIFSNQVKGADVKIFSITGALVYQGQITNSNILTVNLGAGTYLLELRDQFAIKRFKLIRN